MDCLAPPPYLSHIEAWQCWWVAADISKSYLYPQVFLLERTVQVWGRIGKCLQAFAALIVLLDIIGAKAIREYGDAMTSYFTWKRAKAFAMVGLHLLADAFVQVFGFHWCFRLQHIKSSWKRVIDGFATYFRGRLLQWRRILRLVTRTRRAVRVAVYSRKGARAKKLWRQKFVWWAVRADQLEAKYVVPTVAIFSILCAGWLLYPGYQKSFPRGDALAMAISMASYIIVVGIFAALILGIAGLLFAAVRILAAPVILILAVLATVIDIILIEPAAYVVGHQQNANLLKGISLWIFFVGFYFDLLAS